MNRLKNFLADVVGITLVVVLSMVIVVIVSAFTGTIGYGRGPEAGVFTWRVTLIAFIASLPGFLTSNLGRFGSVFQRVADYYLFAGLVRGFKVATVSIVALLVLRFSPDGSVPNPVFLANVLGIMCVVLALGSALLEEFRFSKRKTYYY